jgi:hypothetical protein
VVGGKQLGPESNPIRLAPHKLPAFQPLGAAIAVPDGWMVLTGGQAASHTFGQGPDGGFAVDISPFDLNQKAADLHGRKAIGAPQLAQGDPFRGISAEGAAGVGPQVLSD